MSQSKQSRLKEQQKREAWKKRRHSHGGAAALPEKSSESSTADLKAIARQRSGSLDRVFASDELGLPKISGRLLQLVEPFWDDAPNEDARKNVVTLGAVAWNIAVVPDDERDGLTFNMLCKLVPEFGRIADRLSEKPTKRDLDKALRTIDRESAESVQVYLGLVLGLVERKLLLFPDDGRFIIDHFYTGSGDDETLQVVSSVPDDLVR